MASQIEETVYSSANSRVLDKLQKIHNAALRIVLLVDERPNVKEMHDSLNLLMLRNRKEMHIES